MDEHTKWFYQTRAESVIKALEGNRMSGSYVDTAPEAAQKAMEMISQGASVALGGSMTVVQTGLLAALREAELELIDRWEEGLDPQELQRRLKAGLNAEVMVSGVNAVTEQGELVFVDASCTRVAPILFGPGKVILLAGCNKIVPNLANAQERIRHYVAPTNAKRLGRKTPCAVDGRCHDCDSPERICNATVVIHKQANAQRLHLILVGEDLGL